MKVAKKRTKVAGRTKGTPNKITTDLRERITALVEKNFDKIEEDFNKLDSEKRLIVLERYLKYCLPPLQSLNIQADIMGDDFWNRKIEVGIVNVDRPLLSDESQIEKR